MGIKPSFLVEFAQYDTSTGCPLTCQFIIVVIKDSCLTILNFPGP